MTFLIDTAIWINLLKDRSGSYQHMLEDIIGDAETVITPVIQMEVLCGARNEDEWKAIETVMAREVILPVIHEGWIKTARIYYDLRRKGLTVRSSMDCLIAQSALEHDLTLLHNDRDFEAIAQVRDLKHKPVKHSKS